MSHDLFNIGDIYIHDHPMLYTDIETGLPSGSEMIRHFYKIRTIGQYEVYFQPLASKGVPDKKLSKTTLKNCTTFRKATPAEIILFKDNNDTTV